MKKIKKWIIDMAPIWAKATLEAENLALRNTIKEQEDEIQRLNAYIAGLEFAVRRSPRITIRGGDRK